MQSVRGKGRKLGPVVEGNAASGKEGSASKNNEVYTCRICFEESKDASQLIAPCMCKGTMTVPPDLETSEAARRSISASNPDEDCQCSVSLSRKAIMQILECLHNVILGLLSLRC